MSIEIWVAFVAASTVMLIIPGPTILLVLSFGLSAGRRAALWIAAGVVLGDFAAMTLSLAGMGLLLSASAALFGLVKWIGAGYLIYLGVRMWIGSMARQRDRRPGRRPAGPTPLRSMVAQAFYVTLLNPKGIVFYLAYFPQFISTGQPVLPQVLLLGATFLALSFTNAAGYALLAGYAGSAMSNPAWGRAINRVGGSILIGAGAFTATIRQS